jgi:hypothetical protein
VFSPGLNAAARQQLVDRPVPGGAPQLQGFI